MKTLILLTLMGSAVAVRLSRFLALAQQKEYRLDRLWLFLRSDEGRRELWRIFPRRTDWSWTGFKRPRLTPRLLIVVFLVVLLTCIYGWWAWTAVVSFSAWWWQIIAALFLLLMYIVLIPVFVWVAVLPTVLIAKAVTRYELVRAAAKLAAYEPLIIGITGSYGKTATKQLLAHFLKQKHSVFVTPRSFNTRYSVAHSIRQGYKGEEVVILEYGAYAKGEIAAIAKWFKPRLVALTGLTKQHLGLFSSFDEIIKTKAELVAAVAVNGQVFYNDVDEQVEKIIQVGDPNRLREHIAASQTAVARNIGRAIVSQTGTVHLSWGGELLETKIVGPHYVSLIKLSASVAASLGVSEQQLQAALASFELTNNFICSYHLNSGAVVIDDGGTSNPKGFQAVLDLAAQLEYAHKVLVTPGIVDLGEESEAIHAELAIAAKSVVDQVWHVGEHGVSAFIQHFDQKYIKDQANIITLLKRLPEDSLLIIEGRMPSWFLVELSTIKKQT